ncbi:hypothetical protein GCM10007389_04770 [Pontibacter akesuensis]|nr:hypothetical protein GCM10007389_04770 [Pontibacter akesuensis]
MAACLIGLILLLTLLLLTVLEPYAARMLKKQVTEKTEGLYQLNFKDIDINLLSTSIALQGVHLSPDTAVHRQQLHSEKASAILVELQTPQFKVTGINLLDLIIRKQLSINKVLIKQPHLTLMVDERVQSRAAPKAIQDSSSSGKRFIKGLEVGEIDIPGARVQQVSWAKPNQPIHTLSDLSLRVLGLELDSLQQDLLKNWKTEDVQVMLKAYAYTPPNSVYRFGFDSFRYSTKKEKLQLDNLRVALDSSATTALNTPKTKHLLFNVLVPSLQVTGLNALEAYRTKKLKLAELTLNQAAVELLENPALAADTASLNVKELYAQVSGYLQVVGLEELHLADARFIHRTVSPEVATIQEVKKLNVRLWDVRLDSATLFSPRENLPVQEFLVSARNYHYSNPASVYTLQVGQMELSSKERHLVVDTVRVWGDRSKNKRLGQGAAASAVVYDLQVPRVRITEMDLLKSYQTRLLDVGNISIISPAISMTYYPKVPIPDWKVIARKAYEPLTAFVSDLKVGQLNVQHASFTRQISKEEVRLSQKLEDGSLSLTGIHIDSAFIYQQEPLVPLQSFTFSGRGYKHVMPAQAQSLAIGRFRYSTSHGELTARSISLTSDSDQNEQMQQSDEASRTLFDLSAPLLKVTGLQVIEALNKGRLALKEISLRHPNLSIITDRDISPAPAPGIEQAAAALLKFISPVTVQAVRLEDGTFTYRENREKIIRTQRLEQVSTLITGLKLSPESLSKLDEALPLDEMRVTASNYTYQSPDSVYTISLDSLSYSSMRQELFARYFSLTSDKEAHVELKATNPAAASGHLFDVSTTKFVVTGLDLVRSYETGRFAMAGILLHAPEVAILRDQEVVNRQAASAAPNQAGSTRKKDQPQGQALKQVKDVVHNFSVDRLRLTDGKFKLSVLKDTVTKSQTLEQVSVVLEELRLVSLQAPDPLEMFDVDNVGFLVQDYTYLTPDSLYEFHIGEARTSLRDQTLVVDSLRLKPLFEFEEYTDKLEYATDRVALTIPSIKMQGFRLDALFNEQEIIASNIKLTKPELNLYRNRKVPENPERQPPTLQQMLRNVPYPVQIDSVHIVGGKIVYSEVAANGVAPGVLTLDHTMLQIANITNDSLLLRENSIIWASGTTMFMGESTLKANFAFHMNHPEDLYTYKGTLEPMKFAAFNPLLTQLMFFRMKSGSINQADFTVRATEHMAEGQVDLLYDDLYIQLIDKEDPGNPGLLLNTGSFLLNNLVIKDNNPSRLGNFRKGEIKVERDLTKSVFNHMSGALMSGVASSMMPGWIEKVLSALVGLP